MTSEDRDMLPICRIFDVLTMSSSSSFCAATSLCYLLLPHTYSTLPTTAESLQEDLFDVMKACVLHWSTVRKAHTSLQEPGAQSGLLVAGTVLEITRQVGASVHAARLPRCLQGSKIGRVAGSGARPGTRSDPNRQFAPFANSLLWLV